MPHLTHLLTAAADLRHVTVLCGTQTPERATWLLDQVTCPDCRGARAPCTCRPGRDLCAVCRAWQHTHGADGSRRASPRLPRLPQTETDFQEEVRATALAASWLYFHCHDSRKSPEGFPDCVLVRDTRLVIAELKLPGKLPTEAQQQWLETLAQVTGPPEVYVWRPADLPTILEVLR